MPLVSSCHADFLVKNSLQLTMHQIQRLFAATTINSDVTFVNKFQTNPLPSYPVAFDCQF